MRGGPIPLPLCFLGLMLLCSHRAVTMNTRDTDESIYGDMTPKEYHETRGQGYEVQQRNIELACVIKERFLPAGKTLPPETTELFDDILYTYDQLVQIELATRNIQNKHEKRKIANFTIWKKWDLPVEYTFAEGNFTDQEKSLIEDAVNLWNSLTCIQMRRRTAYSTSPYIVFQADSGGCWSPLGRNVDNGSQPLNLGPGCFEPWAQHRLGIAVHEIGHALGLNHEHSRVDRDDFVDIHWENIDGAYAFAFSMFSEHDQDILEAVPYDVSSVMHYAPWAFRKQGAGFSITPKDALYSSNLGQGYRPTFFDVKAVNLAYCSDTCPTPLYNPCARGGYQDHLNCGSCRCLEGWTGPHCHEMDVGSFGKDPSCPRSGHIWLTSDNEDCIEVRGSHFDNSIQECNWHVQLENRPKTDTIDFWIKDVDLSGTESCSDYVEVKFKEGLDTRGPRFCTRQPADGVDGSKGHFATSETNEITVHYTSFVRNYNPRFSLCFRMSPRCSMKGLNGHGVISATQLATSAPQPAIDVKATLAQLGTDTDPCKTKIIVRTDTEGNVVWAAVSLGMHPNQKKFSKKYNKNYAFNLQGDIGVWERGAKLKNPVEITPSEFPVSWDDGFIFTTIAQIVPYKEWRIEVKCGTKKLHEFEFGKKGNGNVDVSFGKQTGWNGECF